VYSTVTGIFGLDWHVVLFAARAIGGTPAPQAGEVLGLRFFAVEELPEDMLWWHRQRISDACDGVGGGVAWLQQSTSFAGATSREELYIERDRSGLSRLEFYKHHVERARMDEILEVEGLRH
jgi:hypothetical protein